MAFNVDTFRTNLIGDGARPNLFEVSFNSYPSFISAGDTNPQKLAFLCNAAVLPGSTIGVAPLMYFGREVKLAGNRTYPDWTIQVINDEDFAIRNLMENWHFNINGPSGNLRQPGANVVDNGYGADATVVQYGKDGSVLKTYYFKGMWPVDVSTIDLAWGTNDQIEEFSVTFAYQYWTSDDPSSTL